MKRLTSPHALSRHGWGTIAGAALVVVALVWAILTIRGSSGSFARHREAVGLGRHWHLVFLGSAECGPCNDPRLVPALQHIVAELDRETQSVRQGFRTMGVALDDNHSAARRFLRRFGAFDEVSVGGGPFNFAALQYLLREGNGSGTPTVVLLLRDVEMSGTGGFFLGADRTALRLEGLEAIVDYASWLRGSPRSLMMDSTITGQPRLDPGQTRLMIE